MSNDRIKETRKAVQQIRERVRALTKGSQTPGGRAQIAQVRDDYVAKTQQEPENTKRNKESGRKSGNVVVRPNGRNSLGGASNKMAPQVVQRLSGPLVKSPLAMERSENKRLFKSDLHEINPPVAVAASSTGVKSYIETSESAITTPHGAGIRYRGTEYLTNLTTPAFAPGRGEVLYALPISPQIIPDTRLQKACEMFTRYIFKKIRFYYAGTAPTTQSGSLMMFGDYDPSQNPSSAPGDSALRYAFTHKAAEMSVWEKNHVEVTDHVYADMLYCDPDEELRWSVQGCFWLLSSGGLPADTELGKIILEYEIDFAVPDYRGNIINPVTLDTDVSFTGSLGGSLTMTPVAYPPSGAYLCTIIKDLSAAVSIYSSSNAFEQNASAISLAKGTALWCVVTNHAGVTQIDVLWTPDMYSLQGGGNLSVRMAATIGAAVSSRVRFTQMQSVMND